MSWRLVMCLIALVAFGCGDGESGSSGTPPSIHEVGVYKEIKEPIVVDIDIEIEIINPVQEQKAESQAAELKGGIVQVGGIQYEPVHSVGPDPNTSTVRVEYNRGDHNTMHGFHVAIRASDPEVDIKTLRVEQYQGGSSKPVYVDTIELPEQKASNWLYWDAFFLIGQPGEWRTSFMVQDDTGRNSNVYWLKTVFVRK